MSVGEHCPSIKELKFIKGGPVEVGGDLSQPKVVVVEFWATWCPPCRQGIPHLTELQRRFADKGVVVLGVSMDDDVKRVETFVKQMGDKMDYVVAVDVNQTAQRDLYLKSDAGGIPHAFILDRSSKIVFSGHPMDPSFEPKLAEACTTAEKAPKSLEPITDSFEALMSRSVGELKRVLNERNVSYADCLEKADLARRIVERCSNVTYYA